MPNTQTSVPAFTAGQVLTAAQMTEVNTGIPVFATTTTRDAAFGGTGEKTLSEGQFAYIEATNTTQYYDGSTWQTLVTSGLTVVKAETSFSAVTTITADSVFTSSYTNYRAIIKCTSASGTEIALNFRVGGVDASTNYNAIRFTIENTTLTGERRLSQSSGLLGAVGQTSSTVIMDIVGPQLAEASNWISSSFYGSTGNFQRWDGMGVHTTATAYDGIKFTTSVNMTGTYTIYGYGKTA
jgi:hypothetical protein